MPYQVSRNGQIYGPYTLEDLRRYVASGNVLLTDLAKSEEMPEWVPVSQVLGTETPQPTPAGSYQPPVPQAYTSTNLAAYPDAPNLPWGLVLLFSVLTCSVFMFVWNLIVAAWLKRVQPNSNALLYYAMATALAVGQVFTGTHARIHDMHSFYQPHPMTNLLGIIVWVARLVARFTMRSSLEEHFNGPEPIGLTLSGVMTFFFGGLYFQYHLNRINEIKRAARFGGATV